MPVASSVLLSPVALALCDTVIDALIDSEALNVTSGVGETVNDRDNAIESVSDGEREKNDLVSARLAEREELGLERDLESVLDKDGLSPVGESLSLPDDSCVTVSEKETLIDLD